MNFYLGTHEVSWLRRTSVPLFVSHRRLARQKKLPKAVGSWSLDSGGFTELGMHGRWKTTVAEYVDAVAMYRDVVGGMQWAAPMDWMCEPKMLETTGKTVDEHQVLTVANYLELRETGLPFIPVLQGWEIDDYHNCVDVYEEAGVDLAAMPLVGVGSVCRRQHTVEIADIFQTLAERGLSLHGFGVKTEGLRRYAGSLASSDSMAWSLQARRRRVQMPGCTHQTCANCIRYGLWWRGQVVSMLMRKGEYARAA